MVTYCIKRVGPFDTPPESPAPRINGPSVFGVRPGHPILYRLPATGERPMKLSVEGLPTGATFDAASGLLGGAVSKPGDYTLAFTAANTRLILQSGLHLSMMESWRRPSRLMDILMQSYLPGDSWGYDAMDDNGDETDFDDFRKPIRLVFNGLAQAIVRLVCYKL